ncbi:MAG: PilZ domain-containing protein [Deltaproteobacteria bacterium]|nr:PilZ domain-containing protein [Deltaproteobacteria bacterium]
MDRKHPYDRNHGRFRVAACADVTGSEVLLYHQIHDISEGGMRYSAASPDPIGSEVEVLLTFPRTESEVPVKAEVVWVSPDEEDRMVGLRWKDLSPAERLYLRKQIVASMTALVTDVDGDYAA